MSWINRVVAIAREKQIAVSAASLAFYAFNSLVALVLLSYASLTLYGSENALPGLLQLLTGVEAAEFQGLLEQVESSTAGRRRAVALAFVITVWSSLRLFRAVESVFGEIYGIRDERTPLRRLVDSVLVLAAITVVIVTMGAIGSLFLFRTGGQTRSVAVPVVLLFALFALYLPIYYTFAGDGVSVKEVVPGAAFAATAWVVSIIGLRLYVNASESVDLYGVFGGVLLVLTWLYVVALSLLFGVMLNAFLSGHVEADQEWKPLGT